MKIDVSVIMSVKDDHKDEHKEFGSLNFGMYF